MALARIITRSQVCSRELALDLLARGYAVEIVSPDAIPDNLADLELRVEEDPGNQLIANVATHHGERSASLDFVHHLKTPMPDFVRRPSGPQEMVQLSEQSVQPVSFIAEPMNSTTAQTSSSAIKIPGYFPVEEPVIASAPIDDMRVTHAAGGSGSLGVSSVVRSIVRSRLSADGVRSAGWRWRAALTFASVVSLALVLAYGLRRNGNASAQSAATSDEKVAAASNVSALLIPSDAVANAGPIPPTARPVVKESRPPTAGSTSAPSSKPSAASKVPRRHEDDLVARDTVTYLDKGFAPHAVAKSGDKTKPAKQVARKHPRRHKHRDEVIAASKVTYLDKAPKVAK